MQVRLNGEAVQLPEGLTIYALLERLGVDAGQVGVAVAVNRRVLRRSEWASVHLAEGDQVELVYARQGG